MHLSSLPSPYGIGTMGKAAYEFADFLQESGQKLWQMLPISPTSYGDSPYQSFSTFAGNPYFIDLDLLAKDGLLSAEDYAPLDWGGDPSRVDYAKIYENRFPVLKKAYQCFAEKQPEDFEEFAAEQNEWLEDYALFMALKFEQGGAPWLDWPADLRVRKASALTAAKKRLAEEIGFWKFVQYEFFTQWRALKEYVNGKGIRLIGDLPIYVALDSADAWSKPKMFLLDEERQPVVVAGCPPDYFSETGQLWGNPIYNWSYLKRTGYQWWIRRIGAAVSNFDMVRIDHFRGFESFWAIPAGDETAVDGEWRKGPGMDLFRKAEEALGKTAIIAEDLGLITEPVRELLAESGYPGMKVLEFAFSIGHESDYLPHKYPQNCICYTGTHDNDTILGWLKSLSEEELDYVLDYLRSGSLEEGVWDLIALAWSSPADTAITQMQDFLELGSEARMNIPSIAATNWQWRALPGQYGQELAGKIEKLTNLYWR